MHTGIVVEVTAADRDRLEAIVADRNSRQKHVWRAGIVLATAEGSRHGGNCAQHRQEQDSGLALAARNLTTGRMFWSG